MCKIRFTNLQYSISLWFHFFFRGEGGRSQRNPSLKIYSLNAHPNMTKSDYIPKRDNRVYSLREILLPTIYGCVRVLYTDCPGDTSLTIPRRVYTQKLVGLDRSINRQHSSNPFPLNKLLPTVESRHWEFLRQVGDLL